MSYFHFYEQRIRKKKRTPSETGGEKNNIPSPFEVYSRTNHESVRVFSTSMWKPSSSFSAFLQLRLLSFRLASMLCRNSVSFYFFLIYKDDTGYVLHAHKFTVAICHRSSWNAYSLIRTFFGCHSFRRSLTLAYGTVCVLWESAHKKGKSKKNTRNVKHFSDWFNCSALGKLLKYMYVLAMIRYSRLLFLSQRERELSLVHCDFSFLAFMARILCIYVYMWELNNIFSHIQYLSFCLAYLICLFVFQIFLFVDNSWLII